MPSQPLQLSKIRNDSLIDNQNETKYDRVDYRLNGGEIQTFIASSQALTVENLLGELQAEFGDVADTGHSVFGNNAQGAAFTYNASSNNLITIYSANKNGTDTDIPTTLELIWRDASNDFTAYVIPFEDFEYRDSGDYSIILHACGVSEFA